MGMKANSGHFSGTKGSLKYKLEIQYFGIKSKYKTIGSFLKRPSNLGKYKTAVIYTWLKKDYKVKPLSKGRFKGVPYEKGGGFKVNYNGDGLFQYHPKGGHHGGKAYYKISNGKKGTHRYDLNGKEI
jgi:hypothetical protein